jgi:hypothetical protein
MSLPARKLRSPSGSPLEQALRKRNCPRRNQMTARLNLNRKPPVSRELPSRVSISIRTQTLSGGCGELNSLRVSHIHCSRKKICVGDSIHLAIIGATYSFDFSNPPTCRHLQTTYVNRANELIYVFEIRKASRRISLASSQLLNASLEM